MVEERIPDEQIGESSKENKKIKWGWMGLFIAILVVISPLFSIFIIINSWNESITYGLFNLYPNFYYVSIIDVAISLFLILFSIYAGLSLYWLKDRAVFKAKIFLITNLIYGIIIYISNRNRVLYCKPCLLFRYCNNRNDRIFDTT